MINLELPLIPGDEVWVIKYHSSSCKHNWEPMLAKINEISWKLDKNGKDMGPAFIANCTRYKFSGLNKNWFLTYKDCLDAILKERMKDDNKI
jgi:hypothetical protein